VARRSTIASKSKSLVMTPVFNHGLAAPEA
jgi:hypothetical protein